jgi:hypothetical protein
MEGASAPLTFPILKDKGLMKRSIYAKANKPHLNAQKTNYQALPFSPPKSGYNM